MSAQKKMFTQVEFDKLTPSLSDKLTAALTKELADCALPELGDDADSDLWNLPTVDSKTVCKLSPVVKEVLGRRLDPRWIRKGGYNSIIEAISHLVSQLRLHCVANLSSAIAA